MTTNKKQNRYKRLHTQIKDQIAKCDDPISRMATIVAILHHKMDCYFWTGFYSLKDGELIVGPYQGPVACMVLERDKGVCWAGINRQETVIVANVHDFPDHIACDSRSNSEIVVPLKDKEGNVIGVLDVDSKELNSFDEIDKEALEQIMKLI